MIAKPKIRVIIADDHAVYLDGLQNLLAQDDGIETIATAAEGNRLVCLVKQLLPDVVLTDLRMPGMDGIQAIREITELGLPVFCIALSTFDDHALIEDALHAGARGYVTKNAGKGDIIEAIKTVSEVNTYYCRTISNKLATHVARTKYNQFNAGFNEMEKQIIRMVCAEKTSEEISKEMFVPKRTVEGIRARIIERTGVKTPIGLVIYAIKNAIYYIH